MPNKGIGPCGLEFYETNGQASQRFRYFVKTLNADADVSLLRCAKEGSSYAPNCVSDQNVGNGFSFYFICNYSPQST